MKYKVTNIVWDALPYEADNLPKDVEIEAESEESVAEALSNEYDYCVVCYCIDN